MADLFVSRFALKRSASVDTINTNIVDDDEYDGFKIKMSSIVDRIRFSHMLKRGASTSNLFRGQLTSNVTINCNTDERNLTCESQKDDRIQDNEEMINSCDEVCIGGKKEDSHMLKLDRTLQRTLHEYKKIRTSRQFETKIKVTIDNGKQPRNKIQRRRTSYNNDYNKRENDRLKAREMSANLIRAQKVRKEFNDSGRPKPEKNTNSNHTTNRLCHERMPSVRTIPMYFENSSSTKIRFHTASSTLQSPISQHVQPFSTRNPRRLSSTL